MIKMMRLLYSYFRPYQWYFWTAVFFLVLVNGLTYVLPYGIKVIWDEVFPRVKEPGGLALLARWCGILALASLVRALFIFGFINCFWITGAKITNDLRNQLYAKLQRLPFAFYDSARTGDLMSRLTIDVEMVRNLYAFMFEHRSQIVLYLGTVTVLLFWTDWKLAAASLALTPLVVATVLYSGPRLRRAVDQRQQQAGVLNSTVQENIVGIRVVKAFGMEKAEIAKFQGENEAMRLRNLGVSRLQTLLHPFLVFCSSIGVVAVLGYGGYRVIQGELTLGTLMQFMSYLAITQWPLWMLAPNLNQIRQAEGSVQRLLEILNEPEETASPEDGGLTVPDFKGRLEFEAVTFGYQNEPILKEVHLTIEPGEKVAVVGLTGSGKTTLINLIPRFYDPQVGAIRVDGIDLRKLNLNWWRRQVGLVLQETFLFSATIADNIAFGKPEATRAEVEAAARRAQIHDFIQSLPLGYETVVGERGAGLSGGQKQRIAIARALLMNPKILILDDFTSSVDAETELAIVNSLQELMQDRTTILITQRISSARRADRILILESGNIRAQGHHEALLDQDDFYRELYHLQLVGAETELAENA